MGGDRRFVVYGSGGHGKVVADAGISAGFVLAGFIDDDASREGCLIYGSPVLPFARWTESPGEWAGLPVALGIGNNRAREHGFLRLRGAGATVLTIIHRGAILSPSSSIGAGAVIMAGAVVNPDARVGAGAILNTGCVVEHDCVLEDFVHLSPNSALGGGVRIDTRTHLGLCAAVLPLVCIGSDVRVGAGAVVVRDLPDGVTAVGVPARIR